MKIISWTYTSGMKDTNEKVNKSDFILKFKNAFKKWQLLEKVLRGTILQWIWCFRTET